MPEGYGRAPLSAPLPGPARAALVFRPPCLTLCRSFSLLWLSWPRAGDGRDRHRSATRKHPMPAAPRRQRRRTRPAPAPGPQAIKVAVLLPLSGANADLGKAMLEAAQLALFTMGGDNLTLVPRDTSGTAQGAADAAQGGHRRWRQADHRSAGRRRGRGGEADRRRRQRQRHRFRHQDPSSPEATCS